MSSMQVDLGHQPEQMSYTVKLRYQCKTDLYVHISGSTCCSLVPTFQVQRGGEVGTRLGEGLRIRLYMPTKGVNFLINDRIHNGLNIETIAEKVILTVHV